MEYGIDIDTELYSKLNDIAMRENTSIDEILSKLIDDYLEKRGV